MGGFRAITPSINVNTASGQLRTELLNTFSRLDGQLALAPYRIVTEIGPVQSVGSTETDLFSTNIDVGTLNNQGSSILLFACGTTAANGNNKTINVYFGSTEIFTTGAFAGNGISWTIQAEIIRNGATSQICWTQFLGSATLTTAVNVMNASVNLAVGQEVSITGEGTATGDVTGSSFKLLLLA